MVLREFLLVIIIEKVQVFRLLLILARILIEWKQNSKLGCHFPYEVFLAFMRTGKEPIIEMARESFALIGFFFIQIRAGCPSFREFVEKWQQSYCQCNVSRTIYRFLSEGDFILNKPLLKIFRNFVAIFFILSSAYLVNSSAYAFQWG